MRPASHIKLSIPQTPLVRVLLQSGPYLTACNCAPWSDTPRLTVRLIAAASLAAGKGSRQVYMPP